MFYQQETKHMGSSSVSNVPTAGGGETSPAQRSGYPYGVGSSETKC